MVILVWQLYICLQNLNNANIVSELLYPYQLQLFTKLKSRQQQLQTNFQIFDLPINLLIQYISIIILLKYLNTQ